MGTLDRRIRRLLKIAEAVCASKAGGKNSKKECGQLADELFWISKHAGEAYWEEDALIFLRTLIENRFVLDVNDADDEGDVLYLMRLIVLERFYGPLRVFGIQRQSALSDHFQHNAMETSQHVLEACMKFLGLDDPPEAEMEPVVVSPDILRQRLGVIVTETPIIRRVLPKSKRPQLRAVT